MSPAYVVLAALVATAAGADERRIPTFRASSDVVNVDVMVTDKAGTFVDDLEPEQFLVLENFVRQKIAFLDRQAPPIDLILMIDTSASMGSAANTGGTLIQIAREGAKRFVASLRPEDRVLVVEFSIVLRRYYQFPDQLFTDDRDFLNRVIDSIDARGETTSLYSGLYVVLKEVLGKRYARDPEHPHRPIVVILTDGEDNSSLIPDDQALAQARTSGAAVYPIMMPSEATESRWKTIHDATYFLNTLAKETGGSVQKLRSMADLDNAYTLISRELKTQYRLGYQSTDSRANGTWRSLSVTVTGRPDLVVRHRQGYYAPSH